MTTIEPGWYTDPADPATQRYWDGTAWVGKPVPADAEPPAEPEPLDPEPVPIPPVPSESSADRGLTARDFPAGEAPKIIQRTAGAVQPPDTVPIRSLGVTIGWISREDIRRILAGRVLAHPGQRFIARLVDLICLLALNAIINGYFIYQFFQTAWPYVLEAARSDTPEQVELPAAASDQWWVVLLIAMGLWFAYEVPSTLNTGQTLGKRLMGIKVVSLAPVPLGWGRLLLRWSYAALPLICFPFGAILWIVDGIWCIRDQPFRQCLHDKSPGTAVVEVSRDKEPAA